MLLIVVGMFLCILYGRWKMGVGLDSVKKWEWTGNLILMLIKNNKAIPTLITRGLHHYLLNPAPAD